MAFWDRKPIRRAAKKKPQTLDSMLKETVNKEIARDPELRKRLAFKQAGFEDEIQTTDPIEQAKQQLKKKAIEGAMKRMEQDPEVADAFYNEAMAEVFSTKRRKHDEAVEYDENLSSESVLTRAMEQLDDVEELRRKLGIEKSSWTDMFKDPEVMKALIGFVGPMLMNKAQSAGPQVEPARMFVAEVDGKQTVITEEQYNKLYAQGRIKPVVAVAPPKVEPLPQQPIQAQLPAQPIVEQPRPHELAPAQNASVTTVPESIKTYLNTFDLETFTGYLELPPEEFVSQVKTEVLAGSAEYGLLWNFLGTTATPNNIVSTLAPYISDPTYGKYVEKILKPERAPWLKQVIQLAKEQSKG